MRPQTTANSAQPDARWRAQPGSPRPPHVAAAIESLTPECLLAVCRHAAAVHPSECCGTIINGILRRSTNTSTEQGANAQRTFELDADAAIRIAESSRRAGTSAIVYHSHPDGDAVFSPLDETHAAPRGKPLYPDLCHLVVACTDRGVSEARMYARHDGGFAEFARWPAAELHRISGAPDD